MQELEEKYHKTLLENGLDYGTEIEVDGSYYGNVNICSIKEYMQYHNNSTDALEELLKYEKYLGYLVFVTKDVDGVIFIDFNC